ncbi:MAG: flagellar hook-length control protein FliK, partial [Xanthobacteraceae bacterium]
VADSSAKTPVAGDATPQQAAAPVTTPADAAAAPTANLITAHVETAAPSGASSNAQTATNTMKAVTANLPAFGLLTTNSATTQATAAASSTSSAAVSIAGLPIAIAARVQAGSNQFDIRLDPPELGRIDVRLDVDSNGQVTSLVTVDRPETLTLLQSQQPQLERALQQAGLKTADNGLQFSLRDQSFAGQNNGGSAQPNPARQLVVPAADLPPVETTQIYSRLNLGGSGIDIRV